MNKHVKLLIATAVIPTATMLHAQSLKEAVALTEKEQFERATAEFKKLLAGAPNDGQTWFFFGENYYYNERLDSALKCYDRGASVDPLFPLNHAGLAKISWVRGDKQQAQVSADRALTLATDKARKHPRTLQALTYREVAEVYASAPDFDPIKAQAHIDKAIELDPNDAESYILKGDILFDVDPSRASEPLLWYKKAIETAPQAARPVTKKAFIYHRGANYKLAIEEYTKAISLDPSFAPAYRGRAESYFMNKEVDKATADYAKYLELNKGNVSARVRYAKFLYLVGKYAESMQEIAALEGEGAKDPTLKRIEGYDLVELKDFANAVKVLDAYFDMQPVENVIPTDLEYYGRALAALGNDSLAAEKTLFAARMPKADPGLYTEAAKLYARIKRYGMAVTCHEEKLKRAGLGETDWYFLGRDAYKAGLYAKSDSAWAQYIAKRPDLHQGYLGRARANERIDSLKTTWQARPFYEEVVRKIKPEDREKYKVDLEEAYFYLGFQAFKGEKSMGLARCYFEQVKDLNAGTANTKVGSDMLLTKELKDVAPLDCGLL